MSRKIVSAVALTITQLVSATNCRADGTNGLFVRVSSIINNVADGNNKKVVTGAGKLGADLYKVGTGISSLSTFQEKAKQKKVSSEEIRQHGEKAFSSVRGIGGVLGEIMARPAERVGVNNAIKNINEITLAEAYLNGDLAAIETAGRRLEDSRATQRSLPPLSDPSLDILTAGAAKKIKTAASLLMQYWDYATQDGDNNVADNREDLGVPIPGSRSGWAENRSKIEQDKKVSEVPDKSIDRTSDLPGCNSEEYYKIVGESAPCRPSEDVEETSYERGWTDGSGQCFAEGVGFRELATALGENGIGCTTTDVKDDGDVIIYLYDCGAKGIGAMGFSQTSPDAIEMIIEIEAEKTTTRFTRCGSQQTVATDCSREGIARWKSKNPHGIMVQCGNPQ